MKGLSKAMESMKVRPGPAPRRVPDTETRTRPPNLKDKAGHSGQVMEVITNHCLLRSVPGHSIYQYNVSYKPPIESKSLRISLLSQHTTMPSLRVRVFDGMILYLPVPLDEDPKRLMSEAKDGTPVEIIVKLTNKVSANSPTCLQLLNILFRRSEHVHVLLHS